MSFINGPPAAKRDLRTWAQPHSGIRIGNHFANGDKANWQRNSEKHNPGYI